MKIRTGFVSNSSSSSFIIGLAKVPEDWVDELKDNNAVFKYTGPDSIPFWARSSEPGKLAIESFLDDVVSIDVQPGDYVMYLDDSGPEESQMWNEEYGEYDYDVSLDQYDESDQKTAALIQTLGGEIAYGAGRDG